MFAYSLGFAFEPTVLKVKVLGKSLLLMRSASLILTLPVPRLILWVFKSRRVVYSKNLSTARPGKEGENPDDTSIQTDTCAARTHLASRVCTQA